jgi:hypothetical protein
MGTFKLDPKAAMRPILPTAGQYGGGLNNTDVELTRFECPAEDRLPAYDPEGTEGPYAYFGFQATGDHGLIFLDHWEPIGPGTGSRVERWLEQIGVTIVDHEFDPSEVAGRKVVVEVNDPRTAKDGRVYTGNLKNVVAA